MARLFRLAKYEGGPETSNTFFIKLHINMLEKMATGNYKHVSCDCPCQVSMFYLDKQLKYRIFIHDGRMTPAHVRVTLTTSC